MRQRTPTAGAGVHIWGPLAATVAGQFMSYGDSLALVTGNEEMWKAVQARVVVVPAFRAVARDL